MPGRESETFEARAKATCATIHRDVFDELLPLLEAGAINCSPGGVKPSRVSLEAFCARGEEDSCKSFSWCSVRLAPATTSGTL
jgi:hypothetical protein